MLIIILECVWVWLCVSNTNREFFRKTPRLKLLIDLVELNCHFWQTHWNMCGEQTVHHFFFQIKSESIFANLVNSSSIRNWKHFDGRKGWRFPNSCVCQFSVVKFLWFFSSSSSSLNRSFQFNCSYTILNAWKLLNSP